MRGALAAAAASCLSACAQDGTVLATDAGAPPVVVDASAGPDAGSDARPALDAADAADAPTDGSITVGTVSLAACAPGADYYCASLARPLDPAGAVPGSITIHYEWFPHTSPGPSLGTIVAIEGGPGYPSTGSRGWYRSIFDLSDRDMLLVAARGTGPSGAIDCPAAQTAPLITQSDVAACGTLLGPTSDLYGSDLAADDMAAILDALRIDTIDLYGDSYGTLSAQVFTGRHPTRVRTVTLDGAYPALHADPLFALEGPGLRRAFDAACSRSPDCSGATTDRVKALLEALRADPAGAGQVTHGGTVGPMAPYDIGLLMTVAAQQENIFSELDAAIRAYLAGDPAALVRLVDETYPLEEGGTGSKPGEYSIGMFLATTCQDGPTAYDMTLPPGPMRQASYAAALSAQAARDPSIYAPFTLDEYLSVPLDWSITPACLEWPAASAAHPEGHPIPAGAMPDVPALVITGDLDTTTPALEGDQVAAEFAHATRMILTNGGHVAAAWDPTPCTSEAINAFIRTGGTTSTDCGATAVPPLRLVPAFARTVAALPLRDAKGASHVDLQTARAAVLTVSDAYVRFSSLGKTSGAGLRGGTFAARGHGIALGHARFTSDLAVSGDAAVDPKSGLLTAKLTLSGAATGTLTAVWSTIGVQGAATVTGTLNGAPVTASVPAP